MILFVHVRLTDQSIYQGRSNDEERGHVHEGHAPAAAEGAREQSDHHRPPQESWPHSQRLQRSGGFSSRQTRQLFMNLRYFLKSYFELCLLHVHNMHVRVSRDCRTPGSGSVATTRRRSPNSRRSTRRNESLRYSEKSFNASGYVVTSIVVRRH